ncbi:hypothetical protein [Paenibacillus elgii]|uniref:hypothetical protein n=1 Tax=Paenibacillus elgii TaxID=189691 RepID=UPI0013D19700|nr:hypothetical protein [Paenibacillus elgii]
MNDRREQEGQLLQASFMGDIREDIQYLGLTMGDIAWIFGGTLVLGGLVFILPIGFVIKLVWLVVVFVFAALSRYLQWPYRFKRWRRYKFGRRSGTGEDLAEWLGVDPEGWLYKSGYVWHIVLRLQAPPWQTATIAQQCVRVQGYERFLRACLTERVEVAVSSEQVPDFRWEIWNMKRNRPSYSEGLTRITERRLARWQQQARTREAQRTEYTMRLSINEKTLTRLEREDEPPELSKEELKRHRTLADLRERKDLVMSILEDSGHTYTILSGYSVAELNGRQWAPFTWAEWKAMEGTWDDEEDNDLQSTPGLVLTEEPKRLRGKAWKWQRRRKRMIVWIYRTYRKIKDRVIQLLPKKPKEQVRSEEVIELREPAPEALLAPVSSRDESVPRVLLFTSPSSTGKTFLASNIAVASSTAEQPVALVDLSPDFGTLTLVNPIAADISKELWRCFSSRTVPGLTVWAPDLEKGLPVAEEIAEHIRALAETQRVVVDMPWQFPKRHALFELGLPIAVIDSDYHHWTQWERIGTTWPGEVWQNQNEIDMQMLVEELFSLPISRRFPTYPQARQRLYQGRPLALEPEVQETFYWPKGKGGEAC